MLYWFYSKICILIFLNQYHQSNLSLYGFKHVRYAGMSIYKYEFYVSHFILMLKYIF